jgi:hypothetical protein
MHAWRRLADLTATRIHPAVPRPPTTVISLVRRSWFGDDEMSLGSETVVSYARLPEILNWATPLPP